MPVTRPNADSRRDATVRAALSVGTRTRRQVTLALPFSSLPKRPPSVPRLVHGVPVGWSDPHRTRKTDREGQPATRAGAVRKGWLYLTIVARMLRVAPRAAAGMKRRGMRQFLAGNETGRGPDPGSRGICPGDRSVCGCGVELRVLSSGLRRCAAADGCEDVAADEAAGWADQRPVHGEAAPCSTIGGVALVSVVSCTPPLQGWR